MDNVLKLFCVAFVARGVTPMLAISGCVITSLVVEQHSVVYKISIPKCLYFIIVLMDACEPRMVWFYMLVYIGVALYLKPRKNNSIPTACASATNIHLVGFQPMTTSI